MKEVTFFFSLIFIIGCTYIEPAQEAEITTNELDIYLQRFEDEAQQRQFQINLDEIELETTIQEIDEKGVAGICHYSSAHPNRITIDKTFWDNASEFMKEMVVFHELGHCVLGRGHREDATSRGFCKSIMQSGTGTCNLAYNSENRTYYINELFFPTEF